MVLELAISLERRISASPTTDSNTLQPLGSCQHCEQVHSSCGRLGSGRKQHGSAVQESEIYARSGRRRWRAGRGRSRAQKILRTEGHTNRTNCIARGDGGGVLGMQRRPARRRDKTDRFYVRCGTVAGEMVPLTVRALFTMPMGITDLFLTPTLSQSLPCRCRCPAPLRFTQTCSVWGAHGGHISTGRLGVSGSDSQSVRVRVACSGWATERS